MSAFKEVLHALGLWYIPEKDALSLPDVEAGQPRTTIRTAADVPVEIVKGQSGILYKKETDDDGQFEFSYSIWKGQQGRTTADNLEERCGQAGVKLSTVLRIKPLFEQGLTQEAIAAAMKGEPGFGLRTIQKAWSVLSPVEAKEGAGSQNTRKKARLRKPSLIINKL